MLAVDHGEAVAAGVDEEAFEAGDAGAGERVEVRPGCRRRRRPRRPSRPCTGRAAASRLSFEGGDGGGLGEAVEGHVDEGGVAAGGGGAGGGGEAFPFGAAGLVDVDVGVDEAGEEGDDAEVVDGGVGGQFGRALQMAADDAVFEQERGAAACPAG